MNEYKNEIKIDSKKELDTQTDVETSDKCRLVREVKK